MFREGYGLADLRADALAGLTVAIVALPLSMAIAIASGVGPERGLYTAIVGGFIVSLLGGSRVQIGGPAGAFIVLVAAVVQRHGYDGLVLATHDGRAIMMLIGFLRLGSYIKFIPYPVTVGFTAGIAAIILVSQLKDLFGLQVAHEPAEFLPKLGALWEAAGSVRPATVAVALAALVFILVLRRVRPHWPGFLIVVVLGAAAAALGLDVATIGSRFGGIPSMLPAPSLPDFSLAKMQAVLPDALAIALLGSIESLLSAVVADGLTGRRHRSNCELVAQGVANIGSVIFGGICVTGTIARTATNVRAGARGPIAGMFHSLYLLLFMVTAAPLVSYVPLAVLGAILTVVAWNMCEKDEFIALLKSSRGDAVVLLATFLLTVFVDLPTAIAVGVVAGLVPVSASHGGGRGGRGRRGRDRGSGRHRGCVRDEAERNEGRHLRLSNLRRSLLRRDRGGQHDPRPDRPASARVHPRLQRRSVDRQHGSACAARLRAQAAALGHAHLLQRRAARVLPQRSSHRDCGSRS